MARLFLNVVTVMVLLATEVAAGSDADVYVSTRGKDTWSGRLANPSPDGSDGPLATIEAARKKVAVLRHREPARERPITVLLRGGDYYLDRPFRLGPEDSGTPLSPTVYAAYDGEKPVLSGGVPITEWQIAADGHWHTRLPENSKPDWSFTQIFVDEQRRDRPRLPANGWHRVARETGRNQFGYSDQDVNGAWQNLNDVEVLVFHDWSASRLVIASTAPESRTVKLAGGAWQKIEAGSRFAVYNVREALSQPGQWYLDKNRRELTYIPKAGEFPGQTKVIAPRLENVVVLTGDLRAKRWVQYIAFDGLTFAHTNWTIPIGGQSFAQAEIGLDAAIVANGVRNVSFKNCTVRNTGAYAMAFGIGSRDNQVEGCDLRELGGGGIKIGSAGPATWDRVLQIPNDPDLLVSRHVVRDTKIAHGGRLHPGAVGIWVGQAAHNMIVGNEIFDFYQTGISVGWTWGYGRSEAHHNEIAFNHIHAIGQGVSNDMGGIYLLGVQPGTKVHHNHVHDVNSADYGGWGIYADEGTSNVLIENNLVHDTSSGGFHQNFGRNNRVINNIFAFGAMAQLRLTKAESHVSFVFKRNIVYWNNSSPLFGGCLQLPTPCAPNIEFDQNTYWAGSDNKGFFPENSSIDTWRSETGQDLNSIDSDPLFIAPEQGDYALKPGSPALQIGFEPFDRNSKRGPGTPAGPVPP